MRVHERGTIEITRVLQQYDLQRGQPAFALTKAKAVLGKLRFIHISNIR